MASPVQEPSDQPIFNVAQAARYLGVGPRIIRRLCALKKLKFRAVDHRGTIRIHRDALDAYVKGVPCA